MEKNYYLKTANSLGWGPKTVKLNPERTHVLDKFVVGKKVLDIGCGSGIYVDYLTRQGKKAVGIDFVNEFIKRAKKNYRGKFRTANAYKLPFDDNSFDTVMMLDVLEHLDDELKALKEAIRVARKRLILIVPRKVERSLENHGLIYKHYSDSSHLRYYDKKGLQTLAKKLGIKVLKVKEIRSVSIKSFFLHQFIGPLIIKKILLKIILKFLKPVKFYKDIILIGNV